MADPRLPKTLVTGRLLLRPYRDHDAAGLLSLVVQNRQMLLRDFEQQSKIESSEQALSFTREKQGLWREGKEFCYGIWRNGAPEQIGQVRVKNIDWKIPSAELSYFIDERSQRQGFARESIGKIVEAAFESGFERIFIRVLRENQESLALASKLGFRNEGLHRKEFRCGHGQLHDVHYLSLLREDVGLSPHESNFL